MKNHLTADEILEKLKNSDGIFFMDFLSIKSPHLYDFKILEYAIPKSLKIATMIPDDWYKNSPQKDVDEVLSIYIENHIDNKDGVSTIIDNHFSSLSNRQGFIKKLLNNPLYNEVAQHYEKELDLFNLDKNDEVKITKLYNLRHKYEMLQDLLSSQVKSTPRKGLKF